MASMATAVPPLPPEIVRQQQQAMPVAPMMAAMGMRGGMPGMGAGPAALPNPVEVLKQGVAELKAWAARYAPLFGQLHPALATLLVPIAEAGKAIEGQLGELEQRTGGESPQVTGSVAPNVPGNIPGARPAM